MISWIQIAQMIGLLGLALAQNCKPPPAGESMPNIFDLFDSSYSFQVEANYQMQKSTFYVDEVYDKTKNRGKMIIEKEGALRTIVYYSETNEIFDSTGYSCSSKKLTELNEDDFISKLIGWEWMNVEPTETILGPSGLLRKAYVKSKAGKIIVGKEPRQEIVRGMVADVWTWCYNDDVKIKFYFSDKTKERPYGLSVTVPLRVVVEDYSKKPMITEYYEYIGLRLDIPKPELDLFITVPFNVGCQRRTDKVKKIPDSDGRSVHFDAELVYTPFKDNSPGVTYSSNFKIALDMSSNMDSIIAAMEYSTWRSHKVSELAEPGHERKVVVDATNEYQFIKDLSDGTCMVNNINSDSSILTLPDGYKIDIGQWDLFLLTSSSEDHQNNSEEYHYLGDVVERGIPASVFERRIDNDTTLESIIITRYYVADGIVVDNEFHVKNSLMKVVLYRTDMDANEFQGQLVLNVYNYRNTVSKKNEVFDVTSCFTETDESMWFQIVFPLDDMKASDVISMLPTISADYEALLDKLGGNLPPYRIPKLLLDLDQNNLYMTGLLLERPNFMLDFEPQGSRNFKDGSKNTRTIGLRSLEQCAKECLENPECRYFSHCGALCSVAEAKININADTEEVVECAMFQNMKLDSGFGTMDEVSMAINLAVLTGNVIIALPSGDLKAALYRGNLAFGINGLEERPEAGKEGERFIPFKMGYKMSKEEADVGRNPGSMSQETCTRACAQKETCQSLSYCRATQECLLSTKHDDEIKKFDYSSQCATFIRSYKDWFMEFPGLALSIRAKKLVETSSIESCAKACLKETEFNCKSFDLCQSSSNEPACHLHEQHFTEQDEPEHLNVTMYCGHYSRKYLLDFTQKPHKELSKTERGVDVANVTAEGCAQICRDNVGFQCKAFDYCLDPFSRTSTCTLRTDSQDSQMTDQARCNVYVRNSFNDNKDNDKGGQKTEKVETKSSGHSRGATGGLGFLLLLIGLALGVGAIYGFGYWKANRNR